MIADRKQAAAEIVGLCRAKSVQGDLILDTEACQDEVERLLSTFVNQVAKPMREALNFYADPYGRKDECGERVSVPDFYDDLCFGDRAEDALKAVDK